ncbi:hypothetical protein [Halobiforma nitratireducens]|uniref:hypothetical protein n=1 Tax=Halobiforma nitratireducens TaxID=130048 RepID=UPI001268B94E|nr:hypothetical protein [Halobiforma nitratireducens]
MPSVPPAGTESPISGRPSPDETDARSVPSVDDRPRASDTCCALPLERVVNVAGDPGAVLEGRVPAVPAVLWVSCVPGSSKRERIAPADPVDGADGSKPLY